MAQLTDETRELLERADQELQRAMDKFSELQLPDPAWVKLYAPQEIQRRLNEQIEQGMRTIGSGLESVVEDIDKLILSHEKTIKKLTHPLATSGLSIDQPRAQWSDDKARELVRIVGVRGLRAEYDQAMADNDVEFASCLIDWGERFKDPNDPAEFEVMLRVKAAHVEALTFRDRLDSIRALRSKKTDLEGRLKMIAGGHGPDFSQARSVAELNRMVDASGLAYDR